MNLFRSEEHARRWEEFEPKMAAMLHPVQWWADTFATPMFRARARSDFVSWMSGDEGAAAFAALRERLTPPRPDVVATVAAVTALSQVDLSILDGASPDDRTVEQHLMRAWPTAVPVDEVRQWRHTAAAMIDHHVFDVLGVDEVRCRRGQGIGLGHQHRQLKAVGDRADHHRVGQ